MNHPPPAYSHIMRLAVPIIMANSATPLLGLVDTAVIGHVADAAALGGIALGALIFSFIYWGFGFLRMSTSGFVAQAQGRDNTQQIQLTLTRALLLAGLIGIGLLLLQWPLRTMALAIFGASNDVETITQTYFSIRIWSAPACLANYVLAGALIGLGHGRALLAMQLTLNGLNILFDVLFAGYWQMGASGIALGTVLAEWLTMLVTGWRVLNALTMRPRLFSKTMWREALQSAPMVAMLKANRDIMIRTLLLLTGFGIFNDQSARFGDTVLAANHILLQFISFSAFFLDGFAFVTESMAGKAYGACQRAHFAHVIRRTTVLAGITATGLASCLILFGPAVITQLTTIAPVNHTAVHFIPYAACYVLLSFPAFQLDGIFIGCIATRPMRNSALISILVFIGMVFPAASLWGNGGLWIAFIGFVLARALTLGIRLPTLLPDDSEH